LAAAQDSSYAIPPPPRLAATRVPANGVVGIWLSDAIMADSVAPGRLQVQVLNQAGEPVPGTFERSVGNYVTWRPESPLTVGERLAVEVPAYSPYGPPGPLGFTVVEAVDDLGPPQATVGIGLVDTGSTVEDCCEDACFVTLRYSGVHAILYAEIEIETVAEAAQLGQYVYAFSSPVGRPLGWSEAPTINVMAAEPNAPFIPCRKLWASPLAGGDAVEIAEGCVDQNSLLAHGAERPSLEEELSYENCAEPPVPLVDEWCDINREQCFENPDACPGYDRCVIVSHLSGYTSEDEPEDRPDGGPEDQPDGWPDGGPQAAQATSGSFYNEPASTSGCRAGGSAPAGNPWVIAPLLYLVLTASRRRRGTRPQG
jgi:hypothetical protein